LPRVRTPDYFLLTNFADRARVAAAFGATATFGAAAATDLEVMRAVLPTVFALADFAAAASATSHASHAQPQKVPTAEIVGSVSISTGV